MSLPKTCWECKACDFTEIVGLVSCGVTVHCERIMRCKLTGETTSGKGSVHKRMSECPLKEPDDN